MNRWIIFIIIVGIVSVIGVALNFLFTPSSYEDPATDDKESERHTIPDPAVQFLNTSEYTISPGVLVLHTGDFSMNFLGRQAPSIYESLAEVGDPSTVIAALQDDPNIEAVFEVSAIEPNGEQRVIVPQSFFNTRDADGSPILASYMAMIVETNDGVVWLNSVPLHTDTGAIQQESVITEIVDMGTEKNAPIGSGFAGGQPDLTRDTENINNGTSTNEPVQHHPQFYEDNTVSDEIVQIDLNV